MSSITGVEVVGLPEERFSLRDFQKPVALLGVACLGRAYTALTSGEGVVSTISNLAMGAIVLFGAYHMGRLDQGNENEPLVVNLPFDVPPPVPQQMTGRVRLVDDEDNEEALHGLVLANRTLREVLGLDLNGGPEGIGMYDQASQIQLLREENQRFQDRLS